MSRVLEAAGLSVLSSDLYDRGYGQIGLDFLQSGLERKVANIVTNPPFKLAEQFVERALAVSTKKVAMFCRLAWLEGKRRNVMFKSTPLARVWVFSNRLHMFRGGDKSIAGSGGMIAFAWYVWEHGHQGPPTLGWLLAKE